MIKSEFRELQKHIAMKLVDFGVTTGRIDFKKTKKILGTCTRDDNFYKFSYSEYLLESDIELINYTITHELCHTINGCFSHDTMFDDNFKKCAEIIGFDLKACERYLLKVPNTTYIRCNSCGLLRMCNPNHPMVKAMENNINYSTPCSKCGQSEFTVLGFDNTKIM